MLAQAYFCDTAPAKYNSSISMVCSRGCQIACLIFHSHLPHHSVPSTTSIMESVEWRMPKGATCYPSPPSMWVLGSIWSFPPPWPISLPGKIFPSSSELLFMRQVPNVTDNPSSSLLFLSNFHLFNIYFWLSWISVAAHGLSLVDSSRDYSLVAVLELFHCCGFPYYRAQAVGRWA